MNSSGRLRDETSPGTPPAKPIPQAGWRELGLILLRRRLRFRVTGNSMVPMLQPGQEVLVNPRMPAIEGDIVVARHPIQGDRTLIKLLAGYDERGNMILRGLNPSESTDSRSLGGVPMDRLIGTVTALL